MQGLYGLQLELWGSTGIQILSRDAEGFLRTASRRTKIGLVCLDLSGMRWQPVKKTFRQYDPSTVHRCDPRQSINCGEFFFPNIPPLGAALTIRD